MKKRPANADRFVGLPGFEPRQTESKSVVLPLHHNPVPFWECKNKGHPKCTQMFLRLKHEKRAEVQPLGWVTRFRTQTDRIRICSATVTP